MCVNISYLENEINRLASTLPQNLPPVHEDLKDAISRVKQARVNYDQLQEKAGEYFYRLYSNMAPRRDTTNTDGYRISLPRIDNLNLEREATIFLSSVVDNLRVALDYLAFALSAKNCPNLSPHLTNFVIENNRKRFNNQRFNNQRGGLQYLTGEERSFIEKLQPYNGPCPKNHFLRVLRDANNTSKHRHLLKIQTKARVVVIFAEQERRNEYADMMMFPGEDGMAIFVKNEGVIFLFMDRFDMLPVLDMMIKNVEGIIRLASNKFF